VQAVKLELSYWFPSKYTVWRLILFKTKYNQITNLTKLARASQEITRLLICMDMDLTSE